MGGLFRPFGTEVPNERNIARVKNWITDQIYSVLVDYRSSPSAILRKTSVLMQPLMSDPELYLSGYMTVKQLWLATSARTPAFSDRDLFLTFLREWILEDWVFLESMADEALTLDLVIHILPDIFRIPVPPIPIPGLPNVSIGGNFTALRLARYHLVIRASNGRRIFYRLGSEGAKRLTWLRTEDTLAR